MHEFDETGSHLTHQRRSSCVGANSIGTFHDTPELEERVAQMGIKNPKRVYTAGDLAPGNEIVFAACGVTDGALLRGVRFFGEGFRTHTLLMTSGINGVRFIDTVHMIRKPGPKGVRLY